MTVFDWLNSPCTEPSSLLGQCTVLEYLSELVAVNGGSLKITSIGKVIPGEGPYGRIGLNVIEAIKLSSLEGCMNGFFMSTDKSGVDSATHSEGDDIKVVEMIQTTIDARIAACSSGAAIIEIATEQQVDELIKNMKQIDLRSDAQHRRAKKLALGR